jgi:hypothetical protein
MPGVTKAKARPEFTSDNKCFQRERIPWPMQYAYDKDAELGRSWPEAALGASTMTKTMSRCASGPFW